MQTVTVVLSDEMAKLVSERVEAGYFLSPSHMIEDALALLDDRAREKERRLALVRSKLDEAINDPRRLTHEEVRRHLEARLNAGSP